MNGSKNPDSGRLHNACLSIGSNIAPETNLPRAVAMLREVAQLTAVSRCWETRAVGSNGPNFVNMAACLLTPLGAHAFKTEVIGQIEAALGRVRTADKNAPRTIDLDIIVFDRKVVDANLWRRVHVALPFSELLPDLRHPESGRSLSEVAQALYQRDGATLRPELDFVKP